MATSRTMDPDGRQTLLPARAIQKTVDVLVIERQRLRETEASSELLEANRRAIVYWQHELALARHSAHEH